MGGQTGKTKKRKAGNPGVGIDFKKVKHKVGKKLPKAQNDTDTNFKARSIHLPSQAVKDDKTAPTNYQNLTLKELLGQTSHYSEKMRQSALSGLSDLFARHPEELAQHVGLVCSRLAERIADVEGSVRTALQTLFKDRIFTNITPGQIRPFLPMIMAHVSAATTHLSLDVRNDALKVLDILMDFYARLIAESFLTPCLSHFCDLLSSSHRSRSIKGHSLKSLLTVLTSLTDFLTRAFPTSPTGSAAHATSAPTATTSTAAATGTATARGSTQHLPLCSYRCRWPPATAPTTAPTTDARHTPTGPSSPTPMPQHRSNTSTATATNTTTPTNKPTDVIERLLRLLVECWPECSPATVSVSPAVEPVTALCHILTASHILIDRLSVFSGTGGGKEGGDMGVGGGGGGMSEGLSQSLIRAISPHFPATMPAVRPSSTVYDLLVRYNLRASQVLGQLLGRSLRGPAAQETDVPDWAQPLLTWYENVLRTGQVVGAGGLMAEATFTPPSQSDTPQTNTHTNTNKGGTSGGEQGGSKAGAKGGSTAGTQAVTVQLSVLSGVSSLAGVLPGGQLGVMLSAVGCVAQQSASGSAVREACLRLQHRLMTLWQQGEVDLDATWVAGWLGGLPRLLWELGTASPATSALALTILHDAARFCPPALHTPDEAADQAEAAAVAAAASHPLRAALEQLQPQLAPLWRVQLPAKKAGRAPQTVLGPVTKLPVQLQIQAVDILYHLGDLHPALLSAVLYTLQQGALTLPCALRLTEVLVTTATRSAPEDAAALILTLLFAPPPPATPPTTAPTTAPTIITQRALISNVVLQSVQAVCPASVLLHLLTPHLQPLVTQFTQATQSHSGVDATAPAAAVWDTHVVYNTLRLFGLAMDEISHGHTDSVALPGWLETGATDLLVWYSMHTGVLNGGESNVGSQGGLGTSGALTAGQETSTVGVLVRRLCTARPSIAPVILQAAAAGAERLRSACAAGAAAAQYAAVLSLARSVLLEPSARLVLLGDAAVCRAAVGRLVAAEQWPAHVTTNIACIAAVQQLRHAEEYVFGPRAAA